MPERKPDAPRQKHAETIEQGPVVQNEREAKETLEMHKREEAQQDDRHEPPLGAGGGNSEEKR